MNSDVSLEAKVLVQEALLLALAWKNVSPEPLSRLFSRNYSELSKKLNAQQPPNTELVSELFKAFQALSSQLPRNT